MTLQHVIAVARRLHGAGHYQQAMELLDDEMYTKGLTVELHEEMQRLFPVSPDVVQKLADYEIRLSDPDAKIRQKAAKEISRMALGTLSNKTLHFLRYSETTAFITRYLSHPDPVIQENMTIALGMAFLRYTRDDRAFEPLVVQLKSKSINTRSWAIQALTHLSDRCVEHVLPLINDKAERVWQDAFANLGFAMTGGGTLSRQPMGQEGLLKIRAAMLQADRTREAEYRRCVAYHLAATALPEDLPELQAWLKKERAVGVKEALEQGIDRLRNPPAPVVEQRFPVKTLEKVDQDLPSVNVESSASSPSVIDPAFTPCQFVENTEGGSHSLLFTDFHLADDVFEDLDKEGGGYGWHGVTDALVQMSAPKLAAKLDYDPEASMFVALSKDREVLLKVAELIRAAIDDPKLLKRAIKKADPKLMD